MGDGGGSKIVQNSVTSFVDNTLSRKKCSTKYFFGEGISKLKVKFVN